MIIVIAIIMRLLMRLCVDSIDPLNRINILPHLLHRILYRNGILFIIIM